MLISWWNPIPFYRVATKTANHTPGGPILPDSRPTALKFSLNTEKALETARLTLTLGRLDNLNGATFVQTGMMPW